MSKKLLDIDIKIINVLKLNPKISLNKLAKKLNASQQTIKNHIEQLEQEGAIKTALIIDKAYFGYHHIVDILIWIDKNAINSFIELCKNNYIDNICYLSKHWDIGNFNIQCAFKSLNDLQNFIEEIEKLEYIKKIEHHLVPTILFDNDSWCPKF